MMHKQRDRGAAAVEFALVLPILLMLTLGIIYFGHAFHVQTVLDNAARDAVRSYTLQAASRTVTDSEARTNAREVAVAASGPSVVVSPSQVQITPSMGCPSGQNARVAIVVDDFELFDGWWDITITGAGSMRCNG